MNILLTSVGRRGYLVDYFKEAFLGERLIFTANSELTYTMTHADGYLITPLIYENNYISSIINFCKKNEISYVLSLFDIDLFVLAQHEELFIENGITLILAPVDSVEVCNDKWKTYTFLKNLNIPTPKSYLSTALALEAVSKGELTFPLIIKPRWGMASMGIYIVDDKDELEVLYKKSCKEIFNSYLKYESSLTKDEPIIIQELLIGNEYGVDVINDIGTNYYTCLVKQKVRMRAGETDLGLTVDNIDYQHIAKKLSKNIGHKGVLSVDCFDVNGQIYVTEMNCRISGHYPISHAVGFNFPKLLKSWLDDSEVLPQDVSFETQVYVSKELSIRRLGKNEC
ncbi:ATP-grasp domain-containing protein [Pseudoalteromonas sp. SWXJZ94C]|uniref:ATP-grasp domain-containing protein n=1 Tax=Pseudoalteromonas sp. SWXJZ94C TaxID=2792065 RepID=UPI0018CF49D4|nr:ATP-grasp domain-containing protein [Pseudoalteromonas sp. SWXJZ94C]MBH0057939.1 ATP-grasp domain-containing protein [Pseudoalteromonas sp. SWXJZ94C]